MLFRSIPVRSRYPVKVTVVATQWGRTIAPLYQTAEPVTREFYLTSPTLAQDHPRGAAQVSLKAYAFDLQEVRLLDGPFKDNMLRDQQWLLSLENDRLLHTFRLNAGIRTGALALGGWEAPDMELRGHSMGHILSALAHMYASTGDTVYKNKADSLVTALMEVQRVLNQDGYLSAFPQHFIDRCIAGEYVWEIGRASCRERV